MDKRRDNPGKAAPALGCSAMPYFWAPHSGKDSIQGWRAVHLPAGVKGGGGSGIVRGFPPARPTALSIVAASLFCLVVAISDGDTLTVRCGTPGEYRPQRVRIVSIDAPESRQAFGQRARQNLAQLCFRQQAALRTQGHDTYGRLLAHVRCGGRDVAAE